TPTDPSTAAPAAREEGSRSRPDPRGTLLFVFAGSFLVLVALLWRPLTSPWFLVTEAQGGMTLLAAAKSYVEVGVGELRGVPMISVGEERISAPRLYPRHPPLYPLSLAAVGA